MEITDNFRQAINDYIFLLEKHYPEKTIHEMVSTRYSLDHFERSMLFRGITTRETAEIRKKRIITFGQLNHHTLHIDTFNVLFTIAAYLRGFPVYLSKDGLLRDASESHDSNGWIEQLDKALELLLESLRNLNVSKIAFYIDNPLPLSGMMARQIEKATGNLKKNIQVIRDESPDHLIQDATDGAVATSDSTIIDRSALPVFDLPAAVLTSHFEPKIIKI
jgi:hypothetical protein